MTFDQYVKQFRAFHAGLMQAQLGLVVSSEVFADFPKNLPPALVQAINASINVFGKIIDSATSLADPDREKILSSVEDWKKANSESSLPASASETHRINVEWGTSRKVGQPFLLAYLARLHEKSDPTVQFSFGNTVNAQHLFLAFAYADAFAADSILAILEECPERLRRDKKLTWQQVSDFGSWEALVAHMKETLCLEFGLQCLADRISALRDDYGVPISMDDDELNALHETELVRNLFIHAGGIANAEYLKRSRLRSHNVGESIQLSVEDVTKQILLIHKACLAIFDGVSEHFYKKDTRKLAGILRPGEPPG